MISLLLSSQQLVATQKPTKLKLQSSSLFHFTPKPNSRNNEFHNTNKISSFSFSVQRSLSLKCQQSDSYHEQQQQQRQSFSPNAGALPQRVFVSHSIYKGKSALSVDPRAPEFTPLESGAFKLSKEGCVLLQFAPAVGTRVYDWSRKQVFSLSVTEMGTLISLGAKDSCEFFHDPNKGKGADEGKIRKVLKVEPLPDGSGRFFNLSVQNKLIDVDENIYVPVTKAEFAVLVSAFNFLLPYIIGWHAFANTIKPDDTSSAAYKGDYEWNR